MLRSLDIPYTDTRSTDLSWSLDRPPLPALASHHLSWGDDGPRLELRVLGASHQVVLHRPVGSLIETVACVPGSAAPLPAAVARREGPVDYAFSSRIDLLRPADLAARAEEVATLTAYHPRAVIGVFPGRPHSLTALIAHRRPGGVEWETWHTYPEEGAVVVTRGRVTTASPGVAPGVLPIPAARGPRRGPRPGSGAPGPRPGGTGPFGAPEGTRPPGGGSGECPPPGG
ncbi:DUF2617 family protein [Streptomyces sp. IF17]|nr:DUF2617 family protein [Streptomyces alkaliphilus]